MPDAVDFRTVAFKAAAVSDSGRYIGGNIYWKIYSIENLMRVIVNSVLTDVLFTPDWWTDAAGVIKAPDGKHTLNEIVQDRRSQYKNRSDLVRTSLGKHNIYFLTLPELCLIIRRNYPPFKVKIQDLDELLNNIRRIRLPRNIVCHMNWLDIADKDEIDDLYQELVRITKSIENVNMLAPG